MNNMMMRMMYLLLKVFNIFILILKSTKMIFSKVSSNHHSQMQTLYQIYSNNKMCLLKVKLLIQIIQVKGFKIY